MNSIEAILSAEGCDAVSMELGKTVSVAPDSEVMMPIVIEKTDEWKLCVGHYYTQAGDVMSDPEVLFHVTDEGWTPIRFLQDPGIERYDPDGLEIDDFLKQWDQNLRRQGYVDTVRD
jgi:hypothetical protein